MLPYERGSNFVNCDVSSHNTELGRVQPFGPGAGHLQFSTLFMYNVNIL